jgi:hypothetical protein
MLLRLFQVTEEWLPGPFVCIKNAKIFMNRSALKADLPSRTSTIDLACLILTAKTEFKLVPVAEGRMPKFAGSVRKKKAKRIAE